MGNPRNYHGHPPLQCHARTRKTLSEDVAFWGLRALGLKGFRVWGRGF